MSHLPKVSVVVPAYNVSHYVESTLFSLKSQSLTDFEALIVDDGSTDNTAEVVRKFCQQDSRFKLLQKTNGGLSSARNWGIRQVQADYIALLDADDIYFKDKLLTHVTILEKLPHMGVVYSASRAIRDDGNSTFIHLSGKPLYRDPILALMCKNFVGHGSNAVFRRCLIDQVGGFDEDLRSCEDLDFWLRVAAQSDFQFYRVPMILCGYRVRPSGLSFNVAQMQQTLTQVLDAAYARSPTLVAPILPTAKAYMYRYLSRLSMAAGQPDQAEGFIEQAWLSDRTIFFRDARSLLTLLAVKFAPLSRQLISQTLGLAKSTGDKS